MPKDYRTDRKKSRSRSRSKTISKERKDNPRRDRKKTSKWSDAPDSRFTNSAQEFESKNNINSLSNQLLAQQMLLSSRAKMNPTLNCLDDNSKLRLKIYIPKS